jgi:hypothetical protein
MTTPISRRSGSTEPTQVYTCTLKLGHLKRSSVQSARERPHSETPWQRSSAIRSYDSRWAVRLLTKRGHNCHRSARRWRYAKRPRTRRQNSLGIAPSQ